MENVIVTKSKDFAIRIVRAYKYLTAEKNEYIMSKQLLRSGTSIGANAKEGIRGQTKPDFYAKLNIALKQSRQVRTRLKQSNFGTFWLVVIARRQPYSFLRTKNSSKFFPFQVREF